MFSNLFGHRSVIETSRIGDYSLHSKHVINTRTIKKISKKLLPPAFNLTCLCLLLFNLPTGSFILYTETTLLEIHNDLILAMYRGEVTSLILFDLSAAFGTVDHSILLTRLQNRFGLDGLSLDWFSSYLSSCY